MQEADQLKQERIAERLLDKEMRVLQLRKQQESDKKLKQAKSEL